MYDFRSKGKKNVSSNKAQRFSDKIEHKVSELNESLADQRLTASLEDNVVKLKKLFENTDTLVYRDICYMGESQPQYALAYSDGLVNSLILNENIVTPLMLTQVDMDDPKLIDTLMNGVIKINEVKKTGSFLEIVKCITYGDTVLFAQGAAEALILNTKGFQTRSIVEPESEKVISGPREGFTEGLLANLSLIRRRLRTGDLKMRYYSIGRRTGTQACICYLDSLVHKGILDELYKRLDKIDIDGALDTNYINELIKEERFSVFRSTGYTERPDIVVGKLLEGRIAIFLDGSPVVLTVPYLFIENFQSNEDYYLNYMYTSFTRWLRFIGFLLTFIVPSFYIAVVAYNHEMLPTPLLINITAERQSVPLPAAVECFIMLIMFDILKESGVRMPSSIGQTLSIVGALVIGQAAVEAKLIAAPMIIVVALTGITGLLIPKMNEAGIFIRAFLLICSSLLGMFGFTLGFFVITIHLLSLQSMGISQLSISGHTSFQKIKDIFIRAPWWKMIRRPMILTDNQTRMKVVTKNENKE